MNFFLFSGGGLGFFAEFEFCLLTVFAGLGKGDFGVYLFEFGFGYAEVGFGADGLHDDAGGGEHGIGIGWFEDADGYGMVDAGGVVLDVVDGDEIREDGEVGFGTDVAGVPIGEVEAFAIGQGAVTGLAAAVNGGVAGFLVNAWTCVAHDGSPERKRPRFGAAFCG